MLRNIFTLLIISGILISCEGPIGPPGPTGQDGLDGLDGLNGEEAYTFEFTADFISPDFSVLYEFPSSFTMLDSDVALVYALWGEEDGLEIWRQLPQSIFTVDGLLQYNFDFTVVDVSVFMEADFDMDVLGANYTDDWLFRVVVIPAQFQNGRMANDFADYYEVVERFGLTANPVDVKYKNIVRPPVE